MEVNTLQLNITADNKQAIAAMKQTVEATNKMGDASKKTGEAFKTFQGGAERSTNAMMNLGRVLQDAPYGFIGIANNINPLLESFQRLQKETGSFKASIAALGSSLLSGGGLGLAVSAASSLLVVFGDKLFSSKKAADENKEAIKTITTQYDLFTKEIEKAADAAAKESTKVDLLFSALSDSNISLNDRKTIIGQLNEAAPAYLRNLDKEKASYNDIAKSVSDYTNSIAKNAEIKALMPQVEAMFAKIIKAKIELNRAQRVKGSFFEVGEEDIKNFENIVARGTKEIEHAKAALNLMAGGALNLSEILYGKTSHAIEKVTHALKEHNKELKEAVTVEEIMFKFSKKLNNVNPGAPKQVLTTPEKIVDPFTTIFKDYHLENGIGFISMDLIMRTEAALQKLQDFRTNVKDIIKNMLANMATSVGEAIGSIFSGDTKGIFGNLFKVLGAGLKQLGIAAIQYGITMKAIKLAFKTPATAIIAGIALVALGSFIEKSIPKFAKGGITNGPTLAMVGDNPSGREMIIPSEKWGQVFGGGGMKEVPYIASTEISGNNLRIILNRADGSRGRSF